MRSKQVLYLGGLLALVLFDAFRQNYYLQNFNITDQEIPLNKLLLQHLLRWSIWTVIAVAVFIVANNLLTNQIQKWTTRALLITLITLGSILAISIFGIVTQKQPLTISILWEFGQFFFYQKGLAFSLASFIMILHVDGSKKARRLKEASLEIYELKQAVRQGADSNRFIQIKTGYNVKNIAIKDIVWIQSDDYCSKIHTKERSYTIRKSLKSFEIELASFQFFRIHRGALLNLDYLDQINLKASTVRLKTQKEIPASKSGIRMLKREVA